MQRQTPTPEEFIAGMRRQTPTPEEFLASDPSLEVIEMIFNTMYLNGDVWYQALRQLVTIKRRVTECWWHLRCVSRLVFKQRYVDLIEEVHQKCFTLPVDEATWGHFMTCAAHISAEEFVNQVTAFIRKGDLIGKSERHARFVFNWLNHDQHWISMPKMGDEVDRDMIMTLLLPLAVHYGITFQTHPRFSFLLQNYILDQAPYEAVQQWLSAYEMQACNQRQSLVRRVLRRPPAECAQIMTLTKGRIKLEGDMRIIKIYDETLTTLSEIVHEVPSIVLDILRLGTIMKIKNNDYPLILKHAHCRITTCRSSLNDYMIPPMVSIVMEYIG
jgi:hypothetical protein